MICAMHCDANVGIWILWQSRQKEIKSKEVGDYGRAQNDDIHTRHKKSY